MSCEVTFEGSSSQTALRNKLEILDLIKKKIK